MKGWFAFSASLKTDFLHRKYTVTIKIACSVVYLKIELLLKRLCEEVQW
jgi:hypothetical protein